MSDRATDHSQGEGWLTFAGVMLFVAGVLNIIWGISAIDGSSFFSDEGRYVIFDDLNTWGWFFLALGVGQIIAASVWNGGGFGAVFGITCASLNAMVLMFTVNAFPFAAFMLFIVDLLIIYGLVVYGARGRTT